MELEDAFKKLKDKKQVTRDIGVAELQSTLSGSDDVKRTSDLEIVIAKLKELISGDSWEERHGGFCAAKVLVPFFTVDATFPKELEEFTLKYLEDAEVRVRMAVGECLYALAQHQGSGLYSRVKSQVCKSIEENIDANEIKVADDSSATTAPAPENKEDTSGNGVSDAQKNIGKCLETSLKALQRLVEGFGGDIKLPIDSEMWVLLRKTFDHRNRYVRETAFFTLASLCQAATPESLKCDGALIAEGLALGLSDNWSQVRYAASIATRNFMCRTSSYNRSFFPQLLPAMCLNRYYAAEGVRLFSQETWKLILDESGREEVGNNIASVVKHYISQSCAENPQVRESTCHCIGELMVKIDREKIRPHVQPLTVALMNCYQDLSWHVRDAACSGLGKAIAEFPEEARQLVFKLYELWFFHLGDKVSSVRENTAFVLGTAMTTYNLEAIEKVVAKLQYIFKLSETLSEPHHCHSPTGLQEKPCCSRVGVHAAVMTLNGPQGDCVVDRGNDTSSDSITWEESDGAIYLLRELSKVAPERAVEFLPVLAKLTQCPGFQQNQFLLETLYRLLPSIAQNVGKKQFKPCLESYINPLFAALTSGQRLAESASGTCISKLMMFVGPNVFKGRLDEFQMRALQARPSLYSNLTSQ
ncbi:hypothetical protein R1sor_016963 [Riccia sorocarpa]|uniref:ARM repeat superfamily protein n=1 Tax=Riccia sorocarpa TaxID=122646 RepID=A0ABD3I6K4_9MARC